MTRLFIICFALLAGIGSFLAPNTAQAAQSYDNCTGTISSLPAVISTQGTWCMKSDLVTQITQGAAIEILTNNVTIDCNDFKLGNGSANPATWATGIKAYGRLNAVVRHCNIRNFYYGISFYGAGGGGHVIEDSRFDGNTFYGISVQNDNSVIRRNSLFDTGGNPHNSSAYGIETSGTVDIIDNTISDVATAVGSNGWAFGIQTTGGGEIANNRVRNLVADGTGLNYGIVTYAARTAVVGNHVTGVGIDDPGQGIYCGGSNSWAKDNLVNGFATEINANCLDAGGNGL